MYIYIYMYIYEGRPNDTMSGNFSGRSLSEAHATTAEVEKYIYIIM